MAITKQELQKDVVKKTDPRARRGAGATSNVSLSLVAVVEVTNTIKPEDRAKILKALMEQSKFLRSIDVD